MTKSTDIPDLADLLGKVQSGMKTLNNLTSPVDEKVPWWEIDREYLSQGPGGLFKHAGEILFHKAITSGGILYGPSTIKGYVNDFESIVETLKCLGELVYIHDSEEIDWDAGVTSKYNSKEYIYVAENTIVRAVFSDLLDELSAEIGVFSLGDKHLNVLKSINDKYLIKINNNPELFIITTGHGGFKSKAIGRPAAPLIRENYTEKVINDFDYVISEVNADNPFGRLTIINGVPGGGKTFFIRSLIGMIDGSKTKVLFLQPDFLTKQSSASLMNLLLENNKKRLVLIVEDGDECLLQRGNDNMAAVSHLLNWTDGLIGNILDIRVIITTNAKTIEIDDALKRPGRLNRLVQVDDLPAEQANKIYQRLTGSSESPYDKKTRLAEIYKGSHEYKKEV